MQGARDARAWRTAQVTVVFPQPLLVPARASRGTDVFMGAPSRK